MFAKLEYARMRLRNIKGGPAPKLERRCKRLSDLKPENQDRKRRLIELRCSKPDEQEVRDLNLYTSRLTAYEDCCPGAQKIIRLTYRQAGGLFDSRSVGVEHSVMMGGG